MSKGNMLMSQARGKLGGFVYSVVKGQQVQRAYNSKPSNPQTAAQLYQRALFVDAVKFYTRGRRNLFQFAFEDKKRTESDYNAFMRANAKRGVVISKEAFENYPYPALGNFIMSKGTLQPMISSLTNDGMGIQKTISATETPAVATLGDISRVLIDGVDFLDGDIITFVTIVVNDNTNVPSVEGKGGNTAWVINQIQLDANSTQPLSDYELTAAATPAQDGVSVVEIGQNLDIILNTSIAAGVVIHSRNTANGVRVSTEELKLNTNGTNAIEAARARTYVDAVVETWRTTQKAPVINETIMQGNIAQSIAVDFEPAGE